MSWSFGEAPLAETVELAGRLRRLTGLALAQENPSAGLAQLLEELRVVEADLAATAPASSAPRVGDRVDGDGRVYLDHARHIGAYNPAFPTYEITVDGDRAQGQVEFPIAYEGPPGLVHGGFLAVFFDSVIQHHNCEVGVAGKTTELAVRFRRPTPLLVPLTFVVDRAVDGDRITSVARLLRRDQVCAEATMGAIAGDRAALPAVSPRRPETPEPPPTPGSAP